MAKATWWRSTAGLASSSGSTRGCRFATPGIHSNGQLGIDLSKAQSRAPDGPTDNDILDKDDGPNALQNFPELRTIRVSGDRTTVTGDVTVGGVDTFVVEVFANRECDRETGFGEAEVLVASTTASSLLGGGFEVSFPTMPDHPIITAIATGPDGTSKISACLDSRR